MQQQTGQHSVAQRFVGRGEELALLDTLLNPDGPKVIHLYGIAGVGKSLLLDVFTGQARARGAILLRMDCRAMEPTPAGFFRELGSAIGTSAEDLQDALARMAELGSAVIIVLDNYQVYRLMDTWLRQVLVPAMPERIRLLCAGHADLSAVRSSRVGSGTTPLRSNGVHTSSKTRLPTQNRRCFADAG